MKRSLTESQKKVYDFLKSESFRGVPPSVREICRATGLSSTSTVHAHLKTLERLGYIKREQGLNRAIRIAGTENYTQVPVIGTVTAGVPILAVENVSGYIPFLQKPGKDLFALHVQGMSMKNAGILDNDYVISEKVSVASNGEIVVAMIDDEATVKRIFYLDDQICLQPENPDFKAIYSKEAVVLGKVISVIRYY